MLKTLGVSERSVHSWISQGILRCYHVGTLVFLDPQEVVDDIKAHSDANYSPDAGEEGGSELSETD